MPYLFLILASINAIVFAIFAFLSQPQHESANHSHISKQVVVSTDKRNTSL